MPSGPWTEWPIAPGAWAYRQDDRGSLALFGEAGKDAIVSLRCDRAQRRLYLSRLQQFAPKPGQASGHMLRLRAHDGMAGWPARPTGGTPAYLAVELAASEPVLDLLATSRGRFALELEGESSLALPAWSEIFRVIEDCRG